jgi:putative endonuclease
MKFYHVYVLYSHKDNKFYIGYTENLKKRYGKHQQGKVPATITRLPVELIFYEAYKNKYDALRREKYLKSSKGKTTLKSMLKEFINNCELQYTE